MRSGTAAVVMIAVSSPVWSQDDGGVNANLSVSQGITSSSQDGTFGQTELGFGLSSETRVQNLDFQISATLEEQLNNGFATDFVDPSLRLSYGIQNNQSAFDLDARYNRSDVDTLVDLDDGLAEVLVLDNGTRERTGASLGYTFGRDARFGGTFDTSFDSITYSDTTDAGLVDSNSVSADLNLRFEITPRIAATMGYNFREITRSGAGEDVRSTGFNLGADLAVSQTLTTNLSVGTRTVTTETGGITETSDGLTYALNVSQARPNGALTFNLNSNLTESGRRTDLSVGTNFATRSSGDFSAKVGLSQGDSGDINPLYELRYSDSLRVSSYSIFLRQSISTTDLGRDALNSRLQLNYNQALSATTDLQSSLGYQTANVLGESSDTSRRDVTIGLSRTLTDDWNFTSRYIYIVKSENGQPDDTDNRLFLGLETNFGWRP
jgi:hypothetical protein